MTRTDYRIEIRENPPGRAFRYEWTLFDLSGRADSGGLMVADGGGMFVWSARWGAKRRARQITARKFRPAVEREVFYSVRHPISGIAAVID